MRHLIVALILVLGIAMQSHSLGLVGRQELEIFESVASQPSTTTTTTQATATSVGILQVLAPVEPSDKIFPVAPIGNVSATGLPSGSSIVVANSTQVRISSPNFPNAYVDARQVLTWDFQAGDGCRLSASCPCTDIPTSWNCLQSYLKLRTGVLYDLQKYCGNNRPVNFVSNSGELSVRYRSPYSSNTLSTGFICYISCNAPNVTPLPIPPTNCPIN